MKTRLKVLEKDFIINEQAGVVVCKMTFDMKLHDSIFDCLGHDTMKAVHKLFGTKESIYKFSIIGIAKCCPTDTYNEITGKRIAEGKAMVIALKKASNVYAVIARKLAKQAVEALNMSSKCMIVREHEIERIVRINKGL